MNHKDAEKDMMKNQKLFLRTFVYTALGAIGLWTCMAHAEPDQAAPFRLARLRCQQRINPLGVQNSTPSFAWTIESSAAGERQSAYRLLVASSAALAEALKGDLWDTGKVKSADHLHLTYQGAPLRAITKYHWRVQVFNGQDQSAWSPVQSFVMGKLAPTEWRGSWIESGEDTKNAVYIRKVFSLPRAPAWAYLSICGLGGADVYVNGKRVSEELPITSPSNVPSKHNKRTYSAGYGVHDLAALLKPGDNCVGVVLGNAFYHSDSWLRQYDIGQVKLICDLDVGFADGAAQAVGSDETWNCSYGAIKFHDMRYGQEDLDLRDAMPGWSTPAFDAAAWKPVRLVNPQLPKEILRARQEGPIIVYRTLTPAQVKGDRYTLPEYVAGHVRFKATGPAGHEIVVSNGRKPSTFILRGQGAEPYEQRFCLQGTNFVDIAAKGAKIEDVAFVATATHVDRTGDFTCSDPVLNDLSRAGYNTARLMTVGMVGAEMEREKAGWGEDGKNALDVNLYAADMLTIGRKWMWDYLDRQEESGANPSVLPMVNNVGYNGIWQGNALNHVAWTLYWQYGDPRILAEAYAGMQSTMKLLATHAKGDKRQLMGYTLNDWLSAGQQPPPTMTGTIQYYDYALTMARAASVLGKTDDAKTYADLGASIRANFNQLFWDEKTGHYRDDKGNTSMAIQAMAIWFGMVPDDKRGLAAARLKDMVVENKYHPATGFGATASLLGVMMRDYPEVA
jgi:alpha-L-rhamnosidase